MPKLYAYNEYEHSVVGTVSTFLAHYNVMIETFCKFINYFAKVVLEEELFYNMLGPSVRTRFWLND